MSIEYLQLALVATLTMLLALGPLTTSHAHSLGGSETHTTASVEEGMASSDFTPSVGGRMEAASAPDGQSRLTTDAPAIDSNPEGRNARPASRFWGSLFVAVGATALAVFAPLTFYATVSVVTTAIAAWGTAIYFTPRSPAPTSLRNP